MTHDSLMLARALAQERTQISRANPTQRWRANRSWLLSLNWVALWRALVAELQHPNAYLLPLRLFIGLGWLRAGVEKLIDPTWLSGEALATFLQTQISSDALYFPFYQTLTTQLFDPNAWLLSWIVMLGQLLAGLAILSGTLTNLALLGGLFMNLNFVLAGVVNPSAFYIVIQSVLFATNAGATFGGDALLSQRLSSIYLAAQRQTNRRSLVFEKRSLLVVTILSWLLAGWMVRFIRDASPHSVHDPAMLLFILALLGGFLTLIMFVRIQGKEAL